MLSVWEICKWISKLRDQLTFFRIIIIILQFYVAFIMAVASPIVLRQLILPSLIEYTAPLHFNFETCREQLSGVCSFPTATLDISADNVELSPGLFYEVSAEIIVSESAINSNVGIFQAVLESVDENDAKKTFRRSCFATRRGLIYHFCELWWNFACRTIFFPLYITGFLSIANNRKIEIWFTDRLIDRDIAKTVSFSVQLQNRFLEVESGRLFLKARFGLLRIFLHDYPIISSLFIAGVVYFVCLINIAFYWLLRALAGYLRFSCSSGDDLVNGSEPLAWQEEFKKLDDWGIAIPSCVFREGYIANEPQQNFLHQRIRSKQIS